MAPASPPVDAVTTGVVSGNSPPEPLLEEAASVGRLQRKNPEAVLGVFEDRLVVPCWSTSVLEEVHRYEAEPRKKLTGSADQCGEFPAAKRDEDGEGSQSVLRFLEGSGTPQAATAIGRPQQQEKQSAGLSRADGERHLGTLPCRVPRCPTTTIDSI